MKKCMYLLLILVFLTLPVTALAAETVDSVGLMIEGLPTVAEFQAMDPQMQQDAYIRTQQAYDAYLTLSETERSEIAGAEEVFGSLFSHFNSQVMPIDGAVQQEEPVAEKNRTETLWAGAVTLAVVILILRILNRKRT